MTEEETLREWIAASDRIVFFGGAGVSTESGVPDFRSTDGLYHMKYDDPPETILSHTYYTRRPKDFFRFYWDKMIYPDAKPNRAHKALARLEEEGKLTAVITQNIDGLHQDAGSQAVYELHGSVRRNHCERCGAFYDLDGAMARRDEDGVPRCTCGGRIKPDVVLYEEMLDEECMNGAARKIMQADMLIVGGTSLAVWPAAGMIHYYHGHRLVLINKTPTEMDYRADLILRRPIGEVLGEACDV